MADTATLDPVPFNEAINAMAARGVVLPQIYYAVLPNLLRQYAFSVAKIQSIAQLTAILESLNKAINEGTTLATWIAEAKKNNLAVAMMKPSRQEMIFRTNLMGMYNRGREEHAIRHKPTRPYILIDAINDSRVRPEHLAYDGMVTQVGSPAYLSWMNRVKYNCRCTFITLSERQAAIYQKQDAEKLKANPALRQERMNAISNFKPEPIGLFDPLKVSAKNYSGNIFDSELQKLGLI